MLSNEAIFIIAGIVGYNFSFGNENIVTRDWLDLFFLFLGHLVAPTSLECRYDMYYRQAVGTEDVFLGLGDRHPGSSSCTHMTVKVTFPGHQMKDLDLDVTKHKLRAESRSMYALRSNNEEYRGGGGVVVGGPNIVRPLLSVLHLRLFLMPHRASRLARAPTRCV